MTDSVHSVHPSSILIVKSLMKSLTDNTWRYLKFRFESKLVNLKLQLSAHGHLSKWLELVAVTIL